MTAGVVQQDEPEIAAVKGIGRTPCEPEQIGAHCLGCSPCRTEGSAQQRR